MPAPPPRPRPAPESRLIATGERTVPGLPDEEYWFSRHQVAYDWIAGHTAPTDIVVDAGAGEGYGPAQLPGRVRVALDYDETTCRHVSVAYPQVAPVRTNLARLPFATNCVDVLLSCQVLEHLWDPMRFMNEARRVVRPGGRVIVTTPNRITFSPGLGRGERPTNPFHVEEFDADQLRAMLIAAELTDVQILGVCHGPRLVAWEGSYSPIVAAQIDAVTSGVWPNELREMVRTITAADFVISDDLDAAQDLVGLATVSE